MTQRFKKGDKVVPHQKTAGSVRPDERPCNYWNEAQEIGQHYLYVTDYYGGEYVLNIHHPDKCGGGNYYNEEDLELYDDELNQGQEL